MSGVPYTFGTATTSIPLSNLDSNFVTPVTIGNASVALGNTITAIGNLTLNNVTINSGTINASVTESYSLANAVVYSNSSNVGVTSANFVFNGTNVGIGTSSPSYNLDIASSDTTAGIGYAVRLRTNATAAGVGIQFTDNPVTAQYGVLAVDSSSNMKFYTVASERMRIDSSGNLLVGATAASSSSRLYVKSSGSTSSTINTICQNSSGTVLFYARDDGLIVTGIAAASPYNNTTASGANLVVDANGTLYRSTSSMKYKTFVEDAKHGLADVLKLRSVTYKGKNDGNTIFGGLIAEEVNEAGLTEFVQYAEDGTPDALNYGNMVALAFKAIQELNAKVIALESK